MKTTERILRLAIIALGLSAAVFTVVSFTAAAEQTVAQLEATR